MSKEFEIRALTEHDKGYLNGYAEGSVVIDEYSYYFLYRVKDDPSNGKGHKLVSIHHAYTHNPVLLELWGDIENEIESMLKGNKKMTNYIVEGSKTDTGFIGVNYCDEICPWCGEEAFNIPTDRPSLCPSCGGEIFPCTNCKEHCLYDIKAQSCTRFAHTKEFAQKVKAGQV